MFTSYTLGILGIIVYPTVYPIPWAQWMMTIIMVRLQPVLK